MLAGVRPITVIRWIARVLGGALFLLWGAFFVEHLSWFLVPLNVAPSLQIWLAQGLHFLVLLGFLVAYRWERLGGGLVIAGALFFFLITGVWNVLPLFVATVIPAALYLGCSFAGKRPASVAEA
jgi:hypothetical protein